MFSIIRFSVLTIAAISISSIISSVSLAETVCLKSSLKKGKVINSTRIIADGAKCPRGFKILFSSSSFVATNNTNNFGSVGPQGPQGIQGVQGPKRDKGDKGDSGSQGPSGTSNLITISLLSDSNSVSPKSLSLPCPAGTQYITGAGGVIEGLGLPNTGSIAINYSGAIIFGNGHAITAHETSATSGSWQLIAYAVCRP